MHSLRLDYTPRRARTNSSVNDIETASRLWRYWRFVNVRNSTFTVHIGNVNRAAISIRDMSTHISYGLYYFCKRHAKYTHIFNTHVKNLCQTYLQDVVHIFKVTYRGLTFETLYVYFLNFIGVKKFSQNVLYTSRNLRFCNLSVDDLQSL